MLLEAVEQKLYIHYSGVEQMLNRKAFQGVEPTGDTP
jgi:hypothetical protein